MKDVRARWIGDVFHVETNLGIVNIRTGLHTDSGEPVESIEIIPDEGVTLPDFEAGKSINVRLKGRGNVDAER